MVPILWYAIIKKSETSFGKLHFKATQTSLVKFTFRTEANVSGSVNQSKEYTVYIPARESKVVDLTDIDYPISSGASMNIQCSELQKFGSATNSLRTSFESVNSDGSPWEIYASRDVPSAGFLPTNMFKLGKWIQNGITHFVMPNGLIDVTERGATVKLIGDSIIVDNGKSGSGKPFSVVIVWNGEKIYRNSASFSNSFSTEITARVRRKIEDSKHVVSSTTVAIFSDLIYMYPREVLKANSTNPISYLHQTFHFANNVQEAKVHAVILPDEVQQKDGFHEVGFDFTVNRIK